MDTGELVGQDYEYGLAIDRAGDHHNKQRMYIVTVVPLIVAGMCFKRFVPLFSLFGG